jgi:hypothetical protein
VSACPLCRARKGKRLCPARGELICAACCGAKRLIEIDCPESCAYLSGQHAGHWEGRETERKRDLRRVAPFVESLGEPQAQLFFLALVGLTGLRAQRPALDDALLLDAVRSLHRTVETRRKGLLYEHPTEDARAAAVAAELRGLFEARGEDGRPLAPSDDDLAAVLAALEGGLAAATRESSGRHSFLDSAARLAARIGGAARPGPSKPRLILE